ncbi:MAG: type II secretion system F family protein [Chloroflexi bacterium]|nr:type II secretion system F family protein [Chloroflexota bacterium]
MPVSLALAGASFVTVFLLVLALAPPQARRVRDRLAPYGYDAPAGSASVLAEPFWRRVLLPLMDRMAGVFQRVAPARIREQTEAMLEMAGNPIDPGVFLALRLAGLVVLAGIGVFPLVSGAREFTAGNLLLAIVSVYLGARAPLIWLKLKVSARRAVIERALPDAMDLVVVCMEAGMAFDAALHKVAEKIDGPLQAEFERTLQEVHLGKLRREALRDLGRRTGVPDLIAVVSALVQADQMGLSIAHVLRAQADDLRIRRRQRAEEKAQQAPVKMLFPLILCIFPAMMIVTLGPAVMAIYENIILRLAG